MESHSLNPRMTRKLSDMIYNVVFQNTNVNKEDKKQFNDNYISLPLGLWGGRLGVMFRDDINDLFEYFEVDREGLDSTTTTDVQLSSESDIDGQVYYKDIETMDEEMETQKAFMNLHHIYARKFINEQE
jgi:hypothetical protein